MTDPLPWPRNAERYRSDAIRYARTIKRLKENVTRLVQNNPTAVAVLNEIDTKATEIVLALTEAKNGGTDAEM